MSLNVIAPDWRQPSVDQVKALLAAYPEHVAGIMIIPGEYGKKEDTESWGYERRNAKKFKAFVQNFSNKFAVQFCCIILMPPDEAYNMSCWCVHTSHAELTQIADAFNELERTKGEDLAIEVSPYDIHDLLEMVGITKYPPKPPTGNWQNKVKVINRDTHTLSQVLWHLLDRHFRGIYIDQMERLAVKP